MSSRKYGCPTQEIRVRINDLSGTQYVVEDLFTGAEKGELIYIKIYARRF